VWGPIVLCKTCSVLCVLKEPRVENSSAKPFKHGVQLGAIDPIGLWPALSKTKFYKYPADKAAAILTKVVFVPDNSSISNQQNTYRPFEKTFMHHRLFLYNSALFSER